MVATVVVVKCSYFSVPIIPEYLLRISHPNKTDLLLYNKPIQEGESGHKIEKRQILWDDDAWDIPMLSTDMDEDLSEERPVTSTRRPEKNRKTSKQKTKEPSKEQPAIERSD
ncbi:hypothetical protein COOONC_01395 [Cooperia oncophora]